MHLLVHEGIDDIPHDAGGPPPAFQRGDVGPDGGTILVRQRVGEGRRYKVVPVGTGQFEQPGGVGWNIADRKSVIIGREWSRLEKLESKHKMCYESKHETTSPAPIPKSINLPLCVGRVMPAMKEGGFSVLIVAVS